MGLYFRRSIFTVFYCSKWTSQLQLSCCIVQTSTMFLQLFYLVFFVLFFGTSLMRSLRWNFDKKNTLSAIINACTHTHKEGIKLFLGKKLKLINFSFPSNKRHIHDGIQNFQFRIKFIIMYNGIQNFPFLVKFIVLYNGCFSV